MSNTVNVNEEVNTLIQEMDPRTLAYFPIAYALGSQYHFREDVWYFFANAPGTLGPIFIKCVEGNLFVERQSVYTRRYTGGPREGEFTTVCTTSGSGWAKSLIPYRGDYYLGFNMSSQGVAVVGQEMSERLEDIITNHTMRYPDAPAWLSALQTKILKLKKEIR